MENIQSEVTILESSFFKASKLGQILRNYLHYFYVLFQKRIKSMPYFTAENRKRNQTTKFSGKQGTNHPQIKDKREMWGSSEA